MKKWQHLFSQLQSTAIRSTVLCRIKIILLDRIFLPTWNYIKIQPRGEHASWQTRKAMFSLYILDRPTSGCLLTNPIYPCGLITVLTLTQASCGTNFTILIHKMKLMKWWNPRSLDHVRLWMNWFKFSILSSLADFTILSEIIASTNKNLETKVCLILYSYSCYIKSEFEE